MKMKKTIALVIVSMMAVLSLASCKSLMYKDITYKEDGISFTLPNTMRRVTANEGEEYDFYFTNRAEVFTAKKLTEEYYRENSLDSSMTAEEYLNYSMERSGMELDKVEYKYDEERGLHNFRYTYDDGESINIFYYVVIAGEPGNIWYIEMCCDGERYSEFLSDFGVWKRSISTYAE